jgi:hypothetical protein
VAPSSLLTGWDGTDCSITAVIESGTLDREL